MARRETQAEDGRQIGVDNTPVFLDARRRRAVRHGRPGERLWADRFARGSIEELRHALKFACEDLAAGCQEALTVCRILDAAIKTREAEGSDAERFLRIAGARS